MRQPYQTLTILYRKTGEKVLYCVFLRNSQHIWQFISGGGEEGENLVDTVIREIKEETSLIVNKAGIIKLDTQTSIPVINVTGQYTWGEDVYVIPEYTFAVNVKNDNIKLSEEHKEYRWAEFEEAIKLLKFDSNKTALIELNEKLKRGSI